MTETTNQEITIEDVNAQIAQRKEKLAAWRQKEQAYPNTFRRTHLAGCITGVFGDKEKETLAEEANEVKLCGRIMTRRLMGKACFITVQDMSGKMQAYVKKDLIPDGLYDDFKNWDIGDIVGIEGTVFKTQTGELSVRASNIKLLTKALKPLPDKYHGLHDQEMRYRKRYLDLMVNEETRHTFKVRTQLIQAMRQFLLNKQFVEVETPMMQTLPGGAAAKPFATHHNALDMPLYLRIAPELFLKRLVVGGIEQVFEINRNFRNEGLSTRHNPEFTMVEFYQAYNDYLGLMSMTEEMMRYLAQEVLGTLQITYQHHTFDLEQPFARMTVKEAILKYNPEVTEAQLDDFEAAKKIAIGLGIPLKADYGLGKIQIEIFEKTAEHELIQPTFITKYPAEVSPLARKSDDDDFVTDRFEFFMGGREIANGFSELNDPEDQAERFKKQMEAAACGDEEAMPYDEDYINALEYGMPPTAGEGIGIDRLAMVFTNSPSIRDVILFPHMRPTK